MYSGRPSSLPIEMKNFIAPRVFHNAMRETNGEKNWGIIILGYVFGFLTAWARPSIQHSSCTHIYFAFAAIYKFSELFIESLSNFLNSL